MRLWLRAVGVLCLVSFLGLTVAESRHSHAVVESSSECALCTIAHQTPALTSRLVIPLPTLLTQTVFQKSTYHLLYVIPLETHTLSPPIA